MDASAQERVAHGKRSMVGVATIRSWQIGLTLLLAALAGGCDKPSSRLLEVREVVRDDDARSLSVMGSGFPAGTTGDAVFRGVFYRPGLAARRIRYYVPCHTLSDELLRIDLTRVQDTPPEGGLFEGDLDVRFASNAGSSQVVGSIANIRIRFERSRSADLGADLTLARRAREFQRQLGVLELEASTRGLTVLRLAESSALAEASIQVGDRIERLDGTPLERTADLLPQDEHASHVIQVQRKLNGKHERVLLAAKGQDQTHTGYVAGWALLVGLLAGVLLPSEAAGNRVRHVAPATRAVAALLCIASFLAFGLPGLALDIPLFFGAPLLTCLGIAGVGFVRRRASGVHALEDVFALSATSLAMASLAILSGSLTCAWTGPSDSAGPMQWTLLSAPPAWLALAVINAAQPRALSGRFGALAAQWLRWSCAVCIVCLAAGAGGLPHATPPVSDSALLALLMVLLKTVLLTGLLGRNLWHMPRAVWGGLSLVCPAAAWAFLTYVPHPDLFATFGALSFGLVTARALTSHLQAPRVRSRDPVLTPFL